MTLVSGKVWLVEKFARVHPQKWCQMRGVWVFSTIFNQYVVISRKRCILDTKLLWDVNRANFSQASRGFVSDSWAFLFKSWFCIWMQAIEWCYFRWPWVTSDPSFKVTVLLKCEYLENGAFYAQSYYRTVIGNHIQAIDWCHFRWPWVTPDPGFKVMVVLKGVYLQSDAFYR